MSRIAHVSRTRAFDALVVVLALAAAVELVGRRDAPTAPRTTLWFCVPALLVAVLPLFARRRLPFAAPAAYWALAVALTFVDGRLVAFPTGVFALGMAASYLLGNLADERRARGGLAVVLVGAATVVYNKPEASSAELVFIPVVFAISWLAGFALRERAQQAQVAEERAAQAERERDAAARVAVAEERARIARELHDVVAHAVSVMVLQVGAVRHNLPESSDRDALQRVEQTGRTALAEMRHLLGAMRRNGDGVELAPQPGLGHLRALLDDVGRAGLPVRLHVDGDAVPLPRPVDLSAYRIVQEGLTNALKHARASHADVTVRYRPDRVDVEIADDGAGAAAGDGLGHGLIGIRERVRIYGGEMAAGRVAGGGFVLRAHLPLDRRGP